MSTVTSNGPPRRKQLSEQLDRLDTIIDLLAEGLPTAVADAAREGTRLAVKDAILEILSNPELRALIVPPAPVPSPPPAPEPPKSGFWASVKENLTAAKNAAASVVGAAASSAVVQGRKAVQGLTSTAALLAGWLPMKRILLLGTGVGLVVATVSYLLPHAVSATVSGVCGAATAVAAQVGSAVRRYAQQFGLA